MIVRFDRRHAAVRRAVTVAAMLLLLAGAVVVAMLAAVRGSLPVLEGHLQVTELKDDVQIARDALGTPKISGKTRGDVAFGMGFVHAQERFFQMDLLRRSAAGTMSALVGESALQQDRERVIHRFEERAQKVLATMAPDERMVLDSYVSGVNAGLAALKVRPFEYLLLRSDPTPWRPEDTLLVIWSMYFELQGREVHRELARGWLKSRSSESELKFLLPESTEWDATLDALDPSAHALGIPETAPAWLGNAPSRSVAEVPLGTGIGSSNWALAGQRTSHGGAIIATDMHLGLSLPNTWYRASIGYSAGDEKAVNVTGVTLPGAPLVVAGTNGLVGWGFTNSYCDCVDLIELQIDPQSETKYRTANGWASMSEQEVRLDVAHVSAERLKTLETEWGPVWKKGGKSFAVRWVAHDEGAANLRLFRMEQATNVAEALEIGKTAGIPAQNLVVGAKDGGIGWTIAGALPGRRSGFAETFPIASSEASRMAWQRVAAAQAHPSQVNPASGQLWTANSRQLAGEAYTSIGDGGADIGARARQIRDDLSALQRARETDAYAIGLDDRALFMATWRDRALKALDDPSLGGHPLRAEFRQLLMTQWDGHASVDSVAYRLTRSYLYSLYDEVFGALDGELRKLDKETSFGVASPRWPAVLAQLLDQRPQAWLPKSRKSWHELELAAIDDTINRLTEGGASLKDAKWGQRNRAKIAHPLAAVIPFACRWLCAPAVPLAGDGNMPRVSAPSFGQSERMVIAPGHEESALFNMPGGQSGHPLSGYFLAGNGEWAAGKPMPLLPGPIVNTLVLTAARN